MKIVRSVSIDEDVYYKVLYRCKKESRTFSSLVNLLLVKYLEPKKELKREEVNTVEV